MQLLSMCLITVVGTVPTTGCRFELVVTCAVLRDLLYGSPKHLPPRGVGVVHPCSTFVTPMVKDALSLCLVGNDCPNNISMIILFQVSYRCYSVFNSLFLFLGGIFYVSSTTWVSLVCVDSILAAIAIARCRWPRPLLSLRQRTISASMGAHAHSRIGPPHALGKFRHACIKLFWYF